MQKTKSKNSWKHKPENDNLETDFEFLKRNKNLAESKRLIEEKLQLTENQALEAASLGGTEAGLLDINLIEEAPNNWNIGYSDIRNNEQLFSELIDSLKSVGLINAVVVWEKEDLSGYYMLSGHSRLTLFKYLANEENMEGFKLIPAKIYRYEDLTKAKAMRILIDANKGREDPPPSDEILREALLIDSVSLEIDEIREKNPEYTGLSTPEVIGLEIGRSDRHVKNIQILRQRSREQLRLIDEKVLSKKQMMYLQPDQIEYILQNKDIVKKKKLNKLFVKDIKMDELQQIIDGESKITLPDVVTVELPDGKAQEFIEMIQALNIEILNVKTKKKPLA